MNNVIISNMADAILSTLEMDVIKKVQGEYTVDELVSMFSNFFYQKMIIDITAIKGYEDIKNLQNLCIHFDDTKLIIFIGDGVNISNEYISKLISMGIYNFTRNKDGIIKLVNRPNTYADVASLHQIEDKVAIMTRVENSKTKVLGIRNLTEHAGSTTLVYMLKKQLSDNYTVKAIEIDKNDFVFYNDKDMISTTSADLGSELLKLNGNVDIVLIDLNNASQDKACNDVIYLIEPSIIKLNKLVAQNKQVLVFARDKKVVINHSLLSQKDVEEFGMEAGIRVFYVLPPLNDRTRSTALDGLLVKLGFLKQRVEQVNINKDSKLFGLFKRKS